EEECPSRRERQAEMPSGDDESANDHRAAAADEPIGQVAATQWQRVGAEAVEAVKAVGGGLGPAEAAVLSVGEEEDQHRPHSVEREALPHLDAKEQEEAWRLLDCNRLLGLLHERGHISP